jgi:hypothetical protein
MGVADSVPVLLPADIRPLYMRANFEESPVYTGIKAKGIQQEPVA